MALTEKQASAVVDTVVIKVLSMTHNRVAARNGDDADEKAVLKAIAKALNTHAK